MHAPTNGATSSWSGNGHGTTMRVTFGDRAPASIFLLGHVERLSRELGQADMELEALSQRVLTLERRLSALERGAPAEPESVPAVAEPELELAAIPELEPPRLSSEPAPAGLVRLLSRLEKLGLEVGLTETELDVIREESEPLAPPVPVILEVEEQIAPPAPEPVVARQSPASLEPLFRVYPSVAVVLARPATAGTDGEPSGDNGRALFATLAAPPPMAPIHRIEPGSSTDSGPPLQIPASEIFAPSEAHRAFEVGVEPEDGLDELPPPEILPAPRPRNTVFLIAAALAAILLALLVGAALIARAASDDDAPAATATTKPSVSASIPPAAATLQPLVEGSPRVPGIYALISTAGAGGSPISLVGATRAEVDSLLGPPSDTQADGAVVYLNGSALVTYSDDKRVLRVAFDFTTPGDELDQAGAEAILASYRPSDAAETERDTPAAGVERIVYASPSLEATFAGSDTAGRDPAAYVEEIRADADTGQVLTIVIALGDTP